jgi:hypothetical protein
MRSSSSLNQREALQLTNAAVAAGHWTSAVALDGPKPTTMLGPVKEWPGNDVRGERLERRPSF